MSTSDHNHIETEELWKRALEQNLFPGDLIIEIGSFFLNSPYKSGSLEKAGREKLEINLSAFDCMTFVETVLAAAHCTATGTLSPQHFQKKLKYIRYRQGKIRGYASRLHYFTDWLRDNEQKNILKDMTSLLEGSPIRKTINFMTVHHHFYDALKDPKTFAEIEKVEKALSKESFCLIGKNQVARRKYAIQQGDVIAFATDQEGLDVAHVGFAVRQGKKLRLLHASSKAGAVVISPETISEYLKSHKDFTGILVARFSPAGNPMAPEA